MDCGRELFRPLQYFVGGIEKYKIKTARYRNKKQKEPLEFYCLINVKNNFKSSINEEFLIKPQKKNISRFKRGEENLLNHLDGIVKNTDLVVCAKKNVDIFAVSFYKKRPLKLKDSLEYFKNFWEGSLYDDISCNPLHYAKGTAKVKYYKRISLIKRGNLKR